MSDPYIPLENQLKLTRSCLEIIDRYGYGLAIQTKSNRILRDLDLLRSINEKAKCVVQMTLTTYDEDLCKVVEPGVCTTRERAETLKILQKEGIPTIVWMTPILPFLNDTPENIRGLLGYCVESGVKGILTFGMGVTLREGDREYFYRSLDLHFPGLKEKYIRTYGNSYEITSPRNKELMQILEQTCKERGILFRARDCFDYLYTFEEKGGYEQISLF